MSVACLVVPRYLSGRRDGQGSGTGWLMTKSHLLTNYHVIACRQPGEQDLDEHALRQQASGCEVRFDYNYEPPSDVMITDCLLMAYDKRLDYALLQLPLTPTDRQPLVLAPHALLGKLDIKPQDPQNLDNLALNVIQHPGGRAKRIAVRNNLVSRIAPPDVYYFTDTFQGSSGSPVCNDEWQVVALHRGYSRAKGVKFQGKPVAYENHGVLIKDVLNDLSEKNLNVAELGCSLA